MRNKAAFFVLIVLISFSINFPQAMAEDDDVLSNPAGIGELTVQITHYGLVNVDGNPTAIMINLSIPQDDDRQDVDMDIGKIKDSLGTEIGVISQQNPGNIFEYSITGTVKTRANHIYSLPSFYLIPDDVEIYLQPTENIQSSDPEFRELAEEVTEGSKDDFEKVAKIAMWVYEHMDYDLSYSTKNYDALSVLQSKVGVCSEYSTLFIALARSIGIPARFVSGYSYGNRGWERHAYAEVYLGEWIPVDPLWLEIGYLDATHIKFGNHADNYVRNNVEVSGYDVRNIEWAEDDINLSTLSHSMLEKEADYEMTISSEDFRKGDEGVVTLTIVPKEFIVGKVVLEPCSGEYDVVEVEEKGKKVILRPGEKEQIYWKINILEDLPKNYMYRCPLTLNSRSLALKKVDANVNTQHDERGGKKLSASLSSGMLQIGDEQTVYVSVDNPARNSWVGIVAGDEHHKYLMESGDFTNSFSFTPERTGKNSVMVYTTEGETLTLEYDVESLLSISVEDFRAPAYLKVGEKKNVSAYVVNNGPSSQSIHLNIKVDGEDNLANFMLSNRYFVSLPVSFGVTGVKLVRLEVSGGETDLSETRMIEVYEEPVIHYETDHVNGKAILKLNVKNSKIKNVTVRIGDDERGVAEIFGERELEFSLGPGEYPMTITCSDIAGKPYEVSETVGFYEKNILEQILAAINNFIEQIMGYFGP